MLKSCKYCGGIHSRGYICSHKPKSNYSTVITYIDKFRSSKAWQSKRNEIKQRDLYMCQVCARKLFNTISQQYNSVDISVHHINKIVNAWDKRLDNDNLITLCDYHHIMADNGMIPTKELINIVKEQEGKE